MAASFPEWEFTLEQDDESDDEPPPPPRATVALAPPLE